MKTNHVRSQGREAQVLRFLAVGIVLWLVAGWPIAAQGDDAVFLAATSYTPLQVQSEANALASRYADALSETAGSYATPPVVEVINTPNLAYYNHRTQRIVVPHWPSLEGPTRDFFLSLADDESTTAQLFVGLFDWFLVAHEMTHWFQRQAGIVLDRYPSEAMANDLAVAFHMETDHGEERLLALAGLLGQALTRLPDPTPLGESPAAFFNANYRELAVDPGRYGYYQFRFILDAIDRRADLEFSIEVSRAISGT